MVTELKNTQIQCNDLKKQGTNREKEIKKLQKELEVGIIDPLQINGIFYKTKSGWSIIYIEESEVVIKKKSTFSEVGLPHLHV